MRVSRAKLPDIFSPEYFPVNCNYPEEAVGVSDCVWCELQVNSHCRCNLRLVVLLEST